MADSLRGWLDVLPEHGSDIIAQASEQIVRDDHARFAHLFCRLLGLGAAREEFAELAGREIAVADFNGRALRDGVERIPQLPHSTHGGMREGQAPLALVASHAEPVQVAFIAYRNTLQADAIKLVAQKLQSSLVVEGELPKEGLPAYGNDGDDLMLALARKIVAGEEDAGGLRAGAARRGGGRGAARRRGLARPRAGAGR